MGHASPIHRWRSCPRVRARGYRFAPEETVLSVRWYLRFDLSYRDLKELLAERGIAVDHVTVCRCSSVLRPGAAPETPRAGDHRPSRGLPARSRLRWRLDPPTGWAIGAP